MAPFGGRGTGGLSNLLPSPHVDATRRAVDDVVAVLRSHGDRVTGARRAVIDALLAGGHHVTADEIVARMNEREGPGGRGREPDPHRATVYRTLDRLEELGVVSHVHLGHGPSIFHVDHQATAPHHHAVCSACGTVVEVPLTALDGLSSALLAAHGFELSRQHFALWGLCRSCARADRDGTAPSQPAAMAVTPSR